jgi:hypothetical protein
VAKWISEQHSYQEWFANCTNLNVGYFGFKQKCQLVCKSVIDLNVGSFLLFTESEGRGK